MMVVPSWPVTKKQSLLRKETVQETLPTEGSKRERERVGEGQKKGVLSGGKGYARGETNKQTEKKHNTCADASRDAQKRHKNNTDGDTDESKMSEQERESDRTE